MPSLLSSIDLLLISALGHILQRFLILSLIFYVGFMVVNYRKIGLRGVTSLLGAEPTASL